MKFAPRINHALASVGIHEFDAIAAEDGEWLATVRIEPGRAVFQTAPGAWVTGPQAIRLAKFCVEKLDEQ